MREGLAKHNWMFDVWSAVFYSFLTLLMKLYTLFTHYFKHDSTIKWYLTNIIIMVHKNKKIKKKTTAPPHTGHAKH